MPKKISTKCNVFLQLIILRPHPHFTSHVRKNDPQNHPHFTHLKIRRSANPHFTGGQLFHILTILQLKKYFLKSQWHLVFVSLRELVLVACTDWYRWYNNRICMITSEFRSQVKFSDRHNSTQLNSTSIYRHKTGIQIMPLYCSCPSFCEYRCCYCK